MCADNAAYEDERIPEFVERKNTQVRYDTVCVKGELQVMIEAL